jgi:hypothetical protein
MAKVGKREIYQRTIDIMYDVCQWYENGIADLYIDLYNPEADNVRAIQTDIEELKTKLEYAHGCYDYFREQICKIK